MPTDDEYLDDLREFAGELGATPTRTDMDDQGSHSSTPYSNRWGSWNATLNAAGLDTNHESVSDDELLADLQRLTDEHREPVQVTDISDHGMYDPATYFRRFESWLDARELAGLQPEDSQPRRRVAGNELIEAVRELAGELGRSPTPADRNEHGEQSITPSLGRWGTWDQALEAAARGSHR